MKAFVMPVLGTGILLGVVVALGALTITQMFAPERTVVQFASQKTNIASVQNANTSTAPDLPKRAAVYFEAISERPIFAPTRRPAVETVEEIAVIEPEVVPEPVEIKPSLPPNIKLHGISGDRENLSALLSIEGGSPDWAPVGTLFGNWKLTDVGADWVLLKSGDAFHRVELYQ
ncbi:hypothetical protein SAMN04488030_0042 [Aliiroseovarius halocynthiae]|uniref:Type II secretion system protein GspC N-terminal domain-containing protein n=1 Tax=Aliiroseovarius halocynthiae TaxID=985055 RepID=A0A545SLF0_9RHOB|nr:hypothetical protein [Aliiroseovarius halocynthiae]TQV65798.1 hypothetical protein FIL88_15995 [Aliiroseovarius halocynthiae]SMR83565.1 hypothetical protein SAMN04488030_0042 [Aliiroseovarius halocynthiae]